MTKLVTLSGQKPIEGLVKIDPRQLDDYAAGLVFLTIASRFYPGLTWGDLLSPERLGRSFLGRQLDSLKSGAESIYGGIKTVLGDVKDGIGDVAGDAIRLVTDEQVQEGLVRASAAYFTGGQSLSAENVLSQIFGSGNEAAQLKVVEQAGSSYKKMFAEIPQEYLWIGGGAMALLLIIMIMR